MRQKEGYPIPADIERGPRYSNPQLIQKFWFRQKDLESETQTIEIMPDAYFDVVFLLSGSSRRIFLAGPFKEKLTVKNVPNEIELFAIRFRLGCVPLLIDSTPADLVDEMAPLDRLFGMSVEDLGGILWEKKGDVGKQQKILDQLLQRNEPRPMPLNKVFLGASSFIEAKNGWATVHEIADALSITTRTLERHFVATLGMEPKKFLRIVRFKNALQQVQTIGATTTLTNIAMQCGYYDQSHFIRDFKSFAGESPLTYFKRLGLLGIPLSLE